MAIQVKQDVLASDRRLVDEALRSALPQQSSAVCGAMRYAVLGAGQRLRPLLTLRVTRVLDGDVRIAMRSAIAVEMVHCASLIVDDLPCMDNDAVRRNRASVHVEFGEATAILAAFALISLAARLVADQRVFQTKLLAMLDCNSLIGGQSLDLQLGGQLGGRERDQVTALKTVPLFELAVYAGVENSTASMAERAMLFDFGRHFGNAYQLGDDYLDGEIDDYELVARQIELARASLQPLGPAACHVEDLVNYLNAKIWQIDRSNR